MSVIGLPITWLAFDVVTCPSDPNPDYIWVRDQQGNPKLIPCSFNINMEFPRSKARLDLVSKPQRKLLVFDGKPSSVIGSYHISNYNSLYASFRHLGRVNAIYADGHGESLVDIPYDEVRLDD